MSDPSPPPLAPLFDPEHPVPARIELEESSGPVAPAHQFQTRLVVEASGGQVTLSVDDERGWEAGEFRSVLRLREPLAPAEHEALWRDLLALDAFSLGADLVGEEGRGRVGVSFNHLLLRLGDREARVDYRLRDLSRGKFAPQARLVERVRRLIPRG